MPQKAAGARMLPPISDPMPKNAIPAANDAAVPPDDPPGCSREIPRVIGRTVDVVKGLAVHELERHVGGPEQNCSCVQEPAHGYRMRGRPRGLEGRNPPGTRM